MLPKIPINRQAETLLFSDSPSFYSDLSPAPYTETHSRSEKHPAWDLPLWGFNWFFRIGPERDYRSFYTAGREDFLEYGTVQQINSYEGSNNFRRV